MNFKGEKNLNEKNQITLYFVDKSDKDQKEVKLIVTPNRTLNDLLPELSKMFKIRLDVIIIVSPYGYALTISDLYLAIEYLVDRYGTLFYVTLVCID